MDSSTPTTPNDTYSLGGQLPRYQKRHLRLPLLWVCFFGGVGDVVLDACALSLAFLCGLPVDPLRLAPLKQCIVRAD